MAQGTIRRMKLVLPWLRDQPHRPGSGDQLRGLRGWETLMDYFQG